jgi:hypothetical protein
MAPFSLDMSSGDSVLAILIGLLGAFLLHLASKLLETSTPFHVSSITIGRDAQPIAPPALFSLAKISSSHIC